MINIDELIKNAMKSRNKTELQAYQNLKAEIQKFKTAKNAKPYDDAAELTIISKYCKSLEDAIKQFSEARRDDLVASYTAELDILKKLLPAPVGELQIYSAIDRDNFFGSYWTYKSEGEGRQTRSVPQFPKKDMGIIIKHLKSKFPTADCKMISEIVKKYLV